jgi:hypothetical protein
VVPSQGESGLSRSSHRKTSANCRPPLPPRPQVPSIAEELAVPLRVFAATDKDQYRKPDTGMWDRFVAEFNGGLQVGAFRLNGAFSNEMS